MNKKTYWIVSSNNKYFRLDDLLKDRNVVSWRQRENFAVGDMVLIYTTQPIAQITYLMEVIDVNLDISKYIDDKDYWVNVQDYENIASLNKFAIFKLVKMISCEKRLSFNNLNAHGLKSVRGTQRVKQELLDYILSVLSSMDIIYPDEVKREECLFEGALLNVSVNKYERNAEAREKCIELKGCRCLVCGIEFEKIYGEIGKNFIHIHHITPLSSIKENYQIDYNKDLIPVCPNCHSMLHKKTPPYTIDELKKMMNKI
jgi:5-methylcytosine-specific restriction protein A